MFMHRHCVCVLQEVALFAALPKTRVDLWAEEEELQLPEGKLDAEWPRVAYGYTALDDVGAEGRMRAALLLCKQRQQAHDARRRPLQLAADAAARKLEAAEQHVRDAARKLDLIAAAAAHH